jgi:multidrug efflux pump subunit AcrA (membrane-fusion protein)
VAAPLALLVAGAATVVVLSDPDPALTLTAQVTEGQVNKMVTARGTVSAAKTANLSFKAANTVKTVDVKVGDKVRKGQKLGEEDNSSARFALLVAQGTLAAQQAALDLILNDVNPQGLAKIADRWRDVADQQKKNVDLKVEQDQKAYRRLQGAVQFDRAAIRSAQAKLDSDGCTQDGVARPGAALPPLFGAPARPVIPLDPTQTTGPQATCRADYAALQSARKQFFADRTAFLNAKKLRDFDEGDKRTNWRVALKDLETAKNAANIARVNRPNQILQARANVANAQANVAAAQSTVKNSYVYSPVDGVVTGIGNTVGEFSAGGNNLTPGTATAPGGTARIPTVGPLASADQKNLTGGNQLSAVNPIGNAFMQISDINAFQVIAAYPEADVAQITPGALAKVGFDALPGKDYDGTVTAINPTGVAGPEGKTFYYASVLLNSAPEQLRSGMAANVNVVVANVENKAYVVPTAAVRGDEDSSYVYVPGPDGKPHKQNFTKGKVGDDNTQVLMGLKPGDTVLVPETGTLPRASKDADVPPAPAAEQPMTINMDQPKAAPAPAPLPIMPIVGLTDPSMSMGMDTAGAGSVPDSTETDPDLADPTLGVDPAAAPGN